MSSHISRICLNSCVKVPNDPCNNCPGPFFNRPKMYLARLSATPNSCNAVLKQHCSESNPDIKWSCGGIRSLARLYDSIPDYTDLNHLSGKEFYKTLNSLRSTCRELEIKTSCYNPEVQCSTSTSSSSYFSTSIAEAKEGHSKKNKKSKYKKSRRSAKSIEAEHAISNNKESEIVDKKELKSQSNSLSKSSKKNVDKDVEILEKSFDGLETEFKCPITSLNRAESRPRTCCSSKDNLGKAFEYNKQTIEKVPPARSSVVSALPERLRKSLSFNDLHSIAAERLELGEFRKQNKMLDILSFNSQSNFFRDDNKLSNYFKENSNSQSTDIPKIILDSPKIEKLLSNQKSKVKGVKNEKYKMPFKIFDLEASIRKRNLKHSTPSPIHPVARPNLAATLREESSKKKIQELKTNCTFHDITTQYDWEVRKTPAWRSLSLNETHKQILQLRLATRKAEQALQQREYELNMELMRQRVKSAPLLLEGPTYWGPHVGKLTHSCQKDAVRRHLCQRKKRRNNSSRGHSCRHRPFSTTSTLDKEISGNPATTFRIQANSRDEMKHNINDLPKISDSGSNITKSQSRNSTQSTNAQTSFRSKKRSKTKNVQKKEQKSLKVATKFEAVEIDSGDELSSLDRAFL